MEFSIRPIDYGQTEIAYKYRMPNGEQRVQCQVVADLEMRSGINAHSNLIEYVKDALKDKAERDIKDYVRQHAQEGRMPNMVYNEYITSVDYGTGGTGWYDVASTAAATNAVPYQYYRYTQGQFVEGENYDTSRITRTKIVYNDGKRKLIIEKDVNFEIEITPADIQKAREDYWRGARINIIAKKAEARAEDLLKMFISDIDFRNYQEKGFFTVKSGNRIFKIHKDTHKHIDMYEKEGELFVPRNRLCTHTPTRELPRADEAFQKLMLIRSNKVIEHSNLHGASDLKPVREMEELLLV